MNRDHTLFVHAGAAAFLGIEMVLPRLARQNLAILGDFEAFCV